MPNTRVRVPGSAKAGDIIEIRAMIINPFFIRATRSGAVDFLWRDQDGTIIRASAPIVVT
jgi:hypothetical protein